MMQKCKEHTLSNDNSALEIAEVRTSSLMPETILSEKESALQTPKVLAEKGYRFLREIGRGTQAHVYEAEQADGQHVAIKELRVDSIKSWKEYDLFKRESDVLKLLRVDGVARFYDAIESLQPNEPRAYIVQELIDGQSLAEVMSEGIRLDLQEIFEIAVKLVDLLEKLHHNNPPIIHRDIKPSNIMLRPSTTGGYDVFLVDFGAVANPQIQSAGSTVAGTYGYMPPEQLMGTPTPASDIYALGATLVYLLSGIEPSEMQVCDFRLVIEPHLDRVPVNVAAVLRQMLDPNISNRLCDYEQLRNFFKSFAEKEFSVTTGTRGLGTEESDKLLQRVKRLGQTGNLSLWNALSEDVPRRIPRVWVELRRANLVMPVSWGWLRHKRSTGRNRFTFVLLFLILLPILVVAIILFSLLLVWVMDSLFFFYFAIISPILPIGFVCFIYRRLRMVFPYANKQEYSSKELDYIEDGHLENIRMILCQGYKTIATIMDVTYLPAKNEYLERYNLLYYKSNTPKGKKLEDDGSYIYYHYAPCFCVKYVFNYDEKRIIHEIVIHREPAYELEKGTPLPILYCINSRSGEIMSMPYPYPLGDILKLSDVYAKTK